MKVINLYVDDLKKCPNGFIVARNYKEAITYLNTCIIDILSLDHDLGADNLGNLLPTGYDIVKYICENNIFAKKIYIHTDNSVGRENMYETLLAAQRRGFIDSNIQIYRYPIVPNKY